MSYARSPRPLCSITIGIRPRPLGSSISFLGSESDRGFRSAALRIVKPEARHPPRPPHQDGSGTAAVKRQPAGGPPGRRRDAWFPCRVLRRPVRGPITRLERRRACRRHSPSPAPSRRRSARARLRLELGEPLGLLVMPAHDGLGLFVRLRACSCTSALHLLGLRLQVLALHQFGDQQAQRDALLGLRAEHVRRQIARSSGRARPAASGWRPCAARRFIASLSTSDFGTSNLRLLAQSLERLFLHDRGRPCASVRA